jgi:hypothetical protein
MCNQNEVRNMNNEPHKGGTRPVMFSDAALSKFRDFTQTAGIFNQFTKGKGLAQDAKPKRARDEGDSAAYHHPALEFLADKLDPRDLLRVHDMLSEEETEEGAEDDNPDVDPGKPRYLGEGSKQGGTERSESRFNGPSWRKGEGVRGALEDDEYSLDDEHEMSGENDPEEEEEPGREGIPEGEDLDLVHEQLARAGERIAKSNSMDRRRGRTRTARDVEPEVKEPKPATEKPRLGGFKSNARNPERMSHGNTRAADPVEIARLGRKTGEDEPPGRWPGKPRPGGTVDRRARAMDKAIALDKAIARSKALALDTVKRFPDLGRVGVVVPYGEQNRPCMSIYDAMRQQARPMAQDARPAALSAGVSAERRSDFFARYPDARNIKLG